MVEYKIIFSKTALKDKQKIDNSKLGDNLKKLLDIIKKDPFCYPPSYEKLSGKLKIYYSRRINKKHRLVYRIDDVNKEIYVIRMWTHYDNV